MIKLCIALLAALALVGTARAGPVLDTEENALWTLVNDDRQENGVQPLGLNDQLMAAAEWMSGDMAAHDRYSHTDSLGRSLRQRLTDFGYTRYTQTGENLAADRDTAQAAFEAWKGAPEHNATMLHSHYWAVGIARTYDEDSTYGWYWTVDFGGRGPAWFPPTPTPTSSPVPTVTPTPPPVPTPMPSPTQAPVVLPSTGTQP